jgi:ABC-2 type transport system permease protein
MEARLTARRGENLLAMIGIPAGAVLVLATVGSPDGRDPRTLLPAVLALALVASGLVNLGIATAYERGYGVLKRLGGSPLGRAGLLAAKLLVVALIALAQVGALVGLAALIAGWQAEPGSSWAALLVTTIVGSGTFAAIGLFLAGTLRPEAMLVAANAVFLVAVVVGGVLVPIADLPGPLATVARLLPIGALTEAFRASLGAAGPSDTAANLAIVAAWGSAAAIGAIRTFRWE